MPPIRCEAGFEAPFQAREKMLSLKRCYWKDLPLQSTAVTQESPPQS